MNQLHLTKIIIVMALVTMALIGFGRFWLPYSSLIQAWVAILLVLVTLSYVIEVRRQADSQTDSVQEMRLQREAMLEQTKELTRQRKEASRPVLLWKCSGQQTPEKQLFSYTLSVYNSGRGPALKIHSSVKSQGQEIASYNYPASIEPGEKTTFEFIFGKIGNSSLTHSGEPKSRLTVDYIDIYGNAWHTAEEFIWDGNSATFFGQVPGEGESNT